MKKYILVLNLLLINAVLYSQHCDTIDFKTVINSLKNDLNYYKLYIKSDKNKALGFFTGVDLKQILTYQSIKSPSSLFKISFYSNDSLVYELSNLENINFIWLLEKKYYKLRDTLRFSESKTSKKINLEEVFTGYKYLNPKKITIGVNNISSAGDNPALTLFVFSERKLIFTFPKVTRIILHKKLSNKN
ncbi:MAG: hypothetical protein ACK42Z_02900 [Candidatus Kapaibacteriota bacterium]